MNGKTTKQTIQKQTIQAAAIQKFKDTAARSSKTDAKKVKPNQSPGAFPGKSSQVNVKNGDQRSVAPTEEFNPSSTKRRPSRSSSIRNPNTPVIINNTVSGRPRVTEKVHSKQAIKKLDKIYRSNPGLLETLGPHVTKLMTTEYSNGVPNAYPFDDGVPMLQAKISASGEGTGLRVTMMGTDFLGDINLTPANEPGDILYSAPINPHLTPFSRIDIASSSWQKFYFKRFEVVYIPTVGTEENGSLVGTFFSDVMDKLQQDTPSNLQKAYGNFDNVDTNQVWQAKQFCYHNTSRQQDYYTDVEETSINRLTNQGIFQLLLNGAVEFTGTAGVLAVNYEVEFTIPQAPKRISGAAVSYHGTGTKSATNFFGTNLQTQPGSNMTIRTELVQDNWRFFLPRGNWRVTVNFQFSSAPATFSLIPIVASSSGLNFVSLNNHSIGAPTSPTAYEGYLGFVPSSSGANTWYVQSITTSENRNWFSVSGNGFWALISQAHIIIESTPEWVSLPPPSVFEENQKIKFEDAKIEQLRKEFEEFKVHCSEKEEEEGFTVLPTSSLVRKQLAPTK